MDYPEAKITPQHQLPKATFKVALVNRDPAKNVERWVGRAGTAEVLRP